MKFKTYILYFMLFIISALYSQDNNVKISLDINNDFINDTIIHDQNLNVFLFKDKKKNSSQTINFFKNYDNKVATIIISKYKKDLNFELTFAPKYLDKEILNFEYDKLKDNWKLKTVSTHSFDPLNSEKNSEICIYKLKILIYLNEGFYDTVQEKISENSKEYFFDKKCKCIRK